MLKPGFWIGLTHALILSNSKLGVSRRGLVPVVDDRGVVGVITQRDIQRVVGVERRRADVARRAA